ncbi:MAG TPA: type II secretion system protein GspM [Candidatus Binataceae bacterium]|nr:type II secretion system protein GspM [Candidatus Binataceae bacterium]
MMDQLRKLLAQIMAPLARYLEQARDAISPYKAQMQARYQKLEPRERTLVRVAGIVFALFIAYDFFYVPITGWRDSIDTALETRHRETGQVQHLVDTYLERKKQLQDAERSTVPMGKDFSLFSVIEKSMTSSVGRDKIASITPGADRKLPDGFVQYSVDLKLQNVNLDQIVDALYGVKTLSAPVAVSNMHVTRRTQDPHTYDVEMTCIALAKGA